MQSHAVVSLASILHLLIYYWRRGEAICRRFDSRDIL